MAPWSKAGILIGIFMGLWGFSLQLQAATPGLPFTEDFTASNLQDPALTTAHWNTDQEVLVMASFRQHFSLFDASAGAVNAGASSLPTQGVALGDVNGDGLPDMVSANFNNPSIVRLNNGSTDPYPSGTEINPSPNARASIAVVLGDVDNDGDLDAVFANKGAPNSVFYNQGLDGGGSVIWSGEQQVAATNSSSTHSVALGDLDNDGDLDIVFGNDDGQENFWYRNQGLDVTGHVIWQENDLSVDAHYTRGVALADMDQDGDLDVVVSNRGLNDAGESNRVYLNEGAAQPFDLGTPGNDVVENPGGIHDNSHIRASRSIALADLDGDGDIDAAVTNRGASGTGDVNRYYLNQGIAGGVVQWSSGIISAETEVSSGLVLADVDGDGAIDAIVGNFNNTANKFYLNNGTASPFSNLSTTVLLSSDTQNTIGLAADDIDNDGDIDVVMGNFNQQNKLVLNKGVANPFSGTVGNNITTDGQDTVSIALGDMDGDGDLDVVSGNYSQANRLYLNNGTTDPFDGVSGSDITADAHNTFSIALGDMDGDGALDLVVGNYLSQTNRLYLNNGTAAPFNGVSGSDITIDVHNTTSIALGDVDLDGDLDVVAGNVGQENRLYLNNGTVNPFNGAIVRGITGNKYNTFSIALGDVDNDGDLDVVEGNSQGQTNWVYLNLVPTEPFSHILTYQLTSDAHDTLSIALGDMNGDGHLDVVAGNSNQTNRLYLNDGTGTPFIGVTGSDITTDTGSSRSIALDDVDRDGDLDVVAGNYNQTNRLYLNNGTGTPFNGVSGSDITSDDNRTSPISIGDMDGDGDLDMVVGNSSQRNRLYLNNGTRIPFIGVTGSDITTDDDISNSIALGDMDADGDLDVVAGNSIRTDRPNQLYLNNGTSDPFNGVSGSDITSDVHTTRTIALGDVDGDGDLDLVAGNDSVIQTNRLYLNNGTDNPFSGVIGSDITADVQSTRSIALGDMDGDGDLDVVAGNRGQTNRLYLNNGSATPFSSITGSDITDSSLTTHTIALGDVDNDGDLDVVVGNSGFGGGYNVLILNNGTSAPFNEVTVVESITLDRDATNSIALGDVDSDGDLDVVAGNGNSVNRLYLNNGTADPFNGVSGSDITMDTHTTTTIALGDVDGDGDLDLSAGNYIQTNRLYLNNGTADPFNGVSGNDVTADAHFTRSIALGDVDGDGKLDVVVGNYSEVNRLYVRRVFDTVRSKAGSQAVDDTGANIEQVLLSANVLPGDASANTGVNLLLSNNGGAQWFQVKPDTQIPFTFPTTGSDLRWRTELHSLSPVLSSKVRSISLDLAIDTDGDNIYNLFDTDDDNDGLSDDEEINIYGTDPLKVDTDGDGLSDYDEVMTYKTNPLKADTDGDGYSDGDEVNAGTDPLDSKSKPRSKTLFYFSVIQSAL